MNIVALLERAKVLLSVASENDWILLQDMTEKTAGNDNSELVLSLDEARGINDDVYVVHYDMSEIGKQTPTPIRMSGSFLKPRSDTMD